MSACIIDTNVYSAFFKGDAKALAALRMPSEIHLPLIVLGELLGGFAAGTRGPANREKLAAFLATPRVRLMPLDEKTARPYAELFALLRDRRTPIPSNDLCIAALARQHRMPLLSFDVHFATVPGIEAPGFL